MQHLSTLTKQVHEEAAFQRDVHREVSARLDTLSESAGGLGHQRAGPTRRKERRTESQASPSECPKAGLPVPSTPSRSFLPGGAREAMSQQKVFKKKQEGRTGSGSSPILVEDDGKCGGGEAASQTPGRVEGRAAEKGAEPVDPLAAADPWRRIGPTSTKATPSCATSSSWAAFLANASRRPDGVSGVLPRSQSSISTATPARGPTSAGASGGGQRWGGVHRVGSVRDPEPDLFISRQAVVGPFRFRTRSSVAKEKVLQALCASHTCLICFRGTRQLAKR